MCQGELGRVGAEGGPGLDIVGPRFGIGEQGPLCYEGSQGRAARREGHMGSNGHRAWSTVQLFSHSL